MQNDISFEILEYKPSSIETNFIAFKENLESELEKYRGITVTEDSLPICKDIKKELSQKEKGIDSFRKDVKRKLSEPIKDFDDKCKELQKIILEVSGPISEGIEMYNEKFRQEKLELARKYVRELAEKMDFDGIDEVEIKEEYGNVSKTQKEIKQDITAQIIELQEKKVAHDKRVEVFRTIIDLENENLISKMCIDDFTEYINEEYDDAFIIRKIKERSKIVFEAENNARGESDKEKAKNGSEGAKITPQADIQNNSYLIRIFDDIKTADSVLDILRANGYISVLEK